MMFYLDLFMIVVSGIYIPFGIRNILRSRKNIANYKRVGEWYSTAPLYAEKPDYVIEYEKRR